MEDSLIRPARQLMALLLLGAIMSAHQTDALEPLQYTEKFLFSKISYNMLHLTDNMKAAMSGQLKHEPESAPKKVRLDGPLCGSCTSTNMATQVAQQQHASRLASPLPAGDCCDHHDALRC